MEGNFFDDVIVDNALNERFDGIILQDENYKQLQEKIKELSDEYDSLGLSDDQKHVIDRLICATTEIGTYFGCAAYRQGFKDCANLFKEIYTK